MLCALSSPALPHCWCAKQNKCGCQVLSEKRLPDASNERQHQNSPHNIHPTTCFIAVGCRYSVQDGYGLTASAFLAVQLEEWTAVNFTLLLAANQPAAALQAQLDGNNTLQVSETAYHGTAVHPRLHSQRPICGNCPSM
jgi:hypothetical protein